MKYLDFITKTVERRIEQKLSDRFSIAFDGWTCSSTHYVAIFASYFCEKQKKVQNYLIDFSPFEGEVSQDADRHIDFLEFVSSVFGNKLSNAVAIIGDNCSTNNSVSSKLGTGFVGSGSHRFNLWVSKMISQNDKVINQLRLLIMKLSNPINSGRLRMFTYLTPQLRNYTRW